MQHLQLFGARVVVVVVGARVVVVVGAGVVGVGLMFGLGYVLPAFSFSMKLTVSIASACTVLLLAYGIDHSAQAAYKAEVLAQYKPDFVPVDSILEAELLAVKNVPANTPGGEHTEKKAYGG